MPERFGSLVEILVSNLIPGVAWFGVIYMAIALAMGQPYSGQGVPWPSDIGFAFIVVVVSLALGYIMDGIRHFCVDRGQKQGKLADWVRPHQSVDRACLAIGKDGNLDQKSAMYRWKRVQQYHPGELLSNSAIALPFLGLTSAFYFKLVWWQVLVASLASLALALVSFLQGSIYIRDYHKNYEVIFPTKEKKGRG